MMDSITFDASPADEKCAQLNVTPNYHEIAMVECQVYRRQLLRMYKAAHGVESLPEGITLKISNGEVDAGTYHEVGARFDDTKPAAIEAAFWFDANIPAKWDAEARAELEELIPNWNASEESPNSRDATPVSDPGWTFENPESA
jgi:hypothetical protein